MGNEPPPIRVSRATRVPLSITTSLSRRLRCVSLLMMLVVVGGHSPFVSKDTPVWAVIFDGPWAVTFFFWTSGLLLFSRGYRPLRDYVFLVKKRGRSLLLPYLLWCGLGAFCYFLPTAYWTEWMGYWLAHAPEGASRVSTALYVTVLHPVPFPLWYLRTLFLLILLYPVLWLLLRRLGLGIVALVLVYQEFLGQHITPISGQHTYSLIYFLLGGWFGLNGRDPDALAHGVKAPWVYGALWIICLVAKVTLGFESGLVGLLGLFAVWVCYPLYGRAVGKTIGWIAPLSFFIYAFHEPFMDITLGKFILAPSGQDPIVPFLLPLAPAVAVAVAILVGSMLRKVAPSAYALLTGGR